MKTLDAPAAARKWSRGARRGGLRIGFVPTMGYLHDGHLSLVRKARELCDVVVVSIFVNPIQFGPGEDLARYPRDLPRDEEMCRAEGVDMLFVPTAEALYPDGYQTHVRVGAVAESLCGASRPGHFDGVATVVSKLFHIVEPDVAVFGEKDYQQLQVIRRMVRDLDFAVEIVGAPIHREQDGLAMSSRNAYLSPAERLQALCLVRAIERTQQRVALGEKRAGVLLREVRGEIARAGAALDYAALVTPDTLEPVERLEGPALLALAARVGATRLIDNRLLRPPAELGRVQRSEEEQPLCYAAC